MVHEWRDRLVVRPGRQHTHHVDGAVDKRRVASREVVIANMATRSSDRAAKSLGKRGAAGRPSKPDAANMVVGVRLSKRVIGLLDRWAASQAMSRSAAARKIIKGFLDK
jgi:hypothetical protein